MYNLLLVMALEDSEALYDDILSVEDDDSKLRDLNIEILACFKFIADMAFFDFIPLESVI